MNSTGLREALGEWTALLGEEHVVTEAGETEAAGTATFATGNRVPAVLRPGVREDVQECLRIARQHGVPVYPISGGRNWGYGSRVPTADGSVLLDLRCLNRILDFDERLGYVTIGPGVTQGQLYQFLRDHRSHLWMDATGASTEASVVGNAIERGFGHTPYGDRFSHVCGMEVVLPDGSCIETGFHSYPGARSAGVYRWGLGPSVDGLFTQSNFGIVTRITLWLMPAPEYFQAFFFRCDQEAGLGPLIEAVRPLRMNGTLRSTVHIGNDYKVLSGLRQYPWAETGGVSPLGPAHMRRFRKELRFGVWNGSGGLYGTRGQVAEARGLLRKALRGKADKLQFIDDRLLALATRFAPAFRLVSGWDLSRTLELLKPIYGLMKGVPTDKPLESAYWRKRVPAPEHMNPDRDRCGLLWYAPVVPATGEDAEALTRAVCATVLEHGYEPMISMTMVTERCLTCVISISYDRDIPGEDERAMACYGALRDGMIARGNYSYRLGVQSMMEASLATGSSHFLQGLKGFLDPAGILAPSRYVSAPKVQDREASSVERLAAAVAPREATPIEIQK